LAPARGGTPGYWAPEIRKNSVVSPQADAFSYAATLYQLVTGQRPVDGQTLDPWANGFNCLPQLREVIVLCSQTDPNARPTMQQVVRILGGEPGGSVRAEARAQQEKAQEVLIGLALVIGMFFLVPRPLGTWSWCE